MTDARILYVDDDKRVVDAVSETLTRAGGFEVNTADSVDAALRHVRAGGVDCVVSEVGVSDISVASFVDAVDAVDADLPVVLYTDSGSERLAAESVRVGVTDYVVNDGRDGGDQLIASLDRALAPPRESVTHGLDFREGFDRISDAFLSIDDDWRITYVNESGAAFLNHDADDLVGRDIRTLSEDGTTRFHDEYREVLETQSPTTFETESLSKPGHWVEVQVYPAAAGLSIYWQDITEARRRKRVLAELHDGTRDLLAATSSADVCTRATELVESVLGFERGCLVSESTSSPGGTPADAAFVVEGAGSCPQPNTGWETTLLELFRTRDKPLVVDDSVSLDGEVDLPDAEPGVYTPVGSGRFLAARSSTADVGDFDVYCLQLLATAIETALLRMRREQELASNRRAIHSLYDSAIEFQSCTRTEEVLDVAVRTAGDVVSFDRCLFARHDAGALERVAQFGDLPGTEASLPTSVGVSGRSYRTGETIVVDDTTLDDDVHQPCPFQSLLTVPLGEWGVFQAVSEQRAAFDEDDRELAELLAMHVREALARVRSDQALRRERDLLAAFFESSSEPVIRVQFEGECACVEQVNAAFEEVFGIDAETIVGDSIDDYIVPPDEQADARELNRTSSAGEPVEATITRLAADGPRDFLFRSVPLRGEDGTMLSYGIYVDITARTEHLRELERYQTIVESTGDPVYTLDADGYLTYVNEALVSMTGYPATELVGEHMGLLVPDEDLETSRELIRELLCDDERTNDTVELDIRCADGSKLRCEIHIALLPTDEGFVGTAGAIRDITEREARKRELEAQNQRLDEFASVLSHDLRNPLQIAHGHLDLARAEVDHESLDRVGEALGRMDTIVDDVLALARNGAEVSETEPISLAGTAQLGWATVDTGRSQLIVDGDATVHADPDRLRRLFENLFRNAVEHGASAETDAVSIRVGHETGTDDVVSSFSVEDDGVGIAESVAEVIFEAGYSTTEEGTGIGLDIVRGIASAHGWDVWVESGELGGARFVFSV